MPPISRQNALIITIVLAVLFGCTAIFVCLGNVLDVPGFLDATSQGMTPAATLSWLFLIIGGICTAAAFIALPVVSYFVLLHGRSDDSGVAG